MTIQKKLMISNIVATTITALMIGITQRDASE